MDQFFIKLSAETLAQLDDKTSDMAVQSELAPSADLWNNTDAYRRLICGTSGEDIGKTIQSGNRRKIFTQRKLSNPRLVFVVPGISEQNLAMVRALYQSNSFFSEEFDRCCRIIKALSNLDLSAILFSRDGTRSSEVLPMQEHLVNFSFSWSLAKALMAMGIFPDEVIGYSFGEYVSAAISGVLTLTDCLRLILKRMELMSACESGKMLSVPLNADAVRPMLMDGLHLSIDNGNSCIIAGKDHQIDRLKDQLNCARVFCTPIKTSKYPLHSQLMGNIVPLLADFYSTLRKSNPSIKLMNGVTGEYITAEEASHKNYWSDHLSRTILFSKCVEKVASGPDCIFFEVGMGNELSLLITGIIGQKDNCRVLNATPPIHQTINVNDYLFLKIEFLWLCGYDVSE